MEIIKKELEQESLRLKAEQAQDIQKLTSRERTALAANGKNSGVHTAQILVTTHTPQSCWNKHQILTLGGRKTKRVNFLVPDRKPRTSGL
jgi:hypothetical protein